MLELTDEEFSMLDFMLAIASILGVTEEFPDILSDKDNIADKLTEEEDVPSI